MDSMDITEEGTNVTTNYATTGTRVDYNGNSDTTGTYLEVTDIVALKEGRFYELVVKNGSTVIYKDRIFCTNQTVSTYSINNGVYVENTTNNDYIIID
jgi:hypothetical protein